MHTKNNESSIGDWLFLLGGTALVGGYLAYENPLMIQGWLAWLQTLGTTQIAPNDGILAWLVANWGLALLIATIIFAAFKLGPGNAPTVTAEGGNTIKYKVHRHVKVNLI